MSAPEKLPGNIGPKSLLRRQVMMNRFGITACAVASFVALALPCIAQDSNQKNPWNGSWKIDRSTLKYDGPTVSITTDADGYTVTRGGKASPKVVCNGKPSPEPDGATTTCNKVGSGYEVDTSRDGKPVSKGKVELSADGKTLNRIFHITPPDGSPFTMTTTSKKLSGGDGFDGTWKETAFTESQDTGILTIEINGDSVDFKETDNDKPITCKLDGTPVAMGMQGMSVKMDGPRTLKVTYTREGNVARENTFVLSADGKTIQETDVTPAPSASTMSVMFNKS
jgi:hypothetical protein